MRILLGLILLAFPIAEIWLLVELGQQYGWWLLVYLVGIAWLGVRLIKDEKSLLTGRVLQSIGAGNNPMKAMFGSARNIIAGVLLVLPGVITDMIAVILLLIPHHNRTVNYANPSRPGRQAANDDIIEGEFRRED